MTTRHRTTVAALAAAALVGLAGLAAPAATAAPSGLPEQAAPYVRGQAAVARLGDRLPVVAAAFGMNPGELRRLLLDDPSLAVDTDDGLAYFDEPEPADLAPPAAASEPPAPGTEFQLASLPGADKTIYLDFDGHVTTGTTWNSQYGVSVITSPAYDTDGDPGSFSASELQVIRDSWAAVADDFAPWNVNVTTIDPGAEALRRSGGGDTQWGARVVITDDTFANCGCGGHAYIGAFDDSQDEPTFVYNSSFAGVREAISHEVGHMLGLAHDGTSSQSYYSGHSASGTPSWGPIMGASYSRTVTQWSRQEYLNANNTGSGANYGAGEDDLAIISSLTNGNNFGRRADDHGDSLATATALIGIAPIVDGIIGTRTDVDVFWFDTQGGDVSFNADNAAILGNLDIELTLRDSAGGIVAQSNIANGLDAAIATTVPAGTYTVEIDGVGVGSPGSNPPSGYTDYASIGQYTLTYSIDGGSPPDTTPPAAPTGLQGTESGGDAVLSWTANSEPDLAGYTVRRSTASGGPYTDIGTTASTSFTDTSAADGDNFYVVVASDVSGNVSIPSAETVVNIPVDLTSVADDETAVYGTVSGSFTATHTAGGAAQTITETDSGGKPSKRHDRAEHRWSIPASSGNQTLAVIASATDAGDDDDGFSIEWSSNGSVWIPLATVRATSPVDTTFDIGAPTGTVWVRVIDTDRSRGQRSHDSVTVDLLEVSGDGTVVEPPTASTAVASITTSQAGAGKGRHYGVATVQVNDDLGNPVSGAAVTVDFSGDFAGTSLSGTTGGDGSVRLQTATSVKKPSFGACVASLDASPLNYNAGTEAC